MGAAATAQGAANKDAALATGQLSNPNINSPAGTRRVSYTTDPVTGNPIPTITDSYAPGQQALYDKDIALKGLMADLGIGAAGKAQGILGSPVDFSGAPAAPGGGEKTRQQVYDAMMARVNTDYDRTRDQRNSDLIARGIAPGTEAYAREMEMIDRGVNDARNVAIQGSGQEAQRDFGMDMDARRQAITEILAKRQTPINEISAFRSGSQISPLTFQPYTGATVGPAPVMEGAKAMGQAQQNAYNAEAAGADSMMSGLFRLGTSAMMAPAGTFSDRRLKSNVERIGTHPLGIGVYEYDIFGHRERGVMADEVLEVRPDAVMVHESGYLMVDYGALQ